MDVSSLAKDIHPPNLTQPLKNDGWKMSFLLGLPISRGYVKFLGCKDKNLCSNKKVDNSHRSGQLQQQVLLMLLFQATPKIWPNYNISPT